LGDVHISTACIHESRRKAIWLLLSSSKSQQAKRAFKRQHEQTLGASKISLFDKKDFD